MDFSQRLRFGSLLTFLVLCVSALLAGQEKAGEEKILTLPIGKIKYQGQNIEIGSGQIFSSESRKPITFDQMVSEMRDCRFVYVGETHNSLPMHEIQLKIIRALYARDPSWAIGLEMFPVTVQEVLNKWSLGILTEEEFVREAQWYIHWNFNFKFYQKIFLFAKENKIPMFALNVPREIITKIRMKGWEALSEGEKTLVSQPDVSHQDHRLLIRTVFETSDIPQQMKGPGLDAVFEGLYRSQVAWDTAMAASARLNAEKFGKKMVVLAGSGHLLYNLGINFRVYEHSPVPFKTIISVAIPEEKKRQVVSRSLADFVWGIPEEGQPAFPSVGLSFKKFGGLENIVIDSKPIDGAAKGGDFEKGDIVLFVDGRPYSDIQELRLFLARFGWGDEVRFRLLRSGQEKEVTLKFQHTEPKLQ